MLGVWLDNHSFSGSFPIHCTEVFVVHRSITEIENNKVLKKNLEILQLANSLNSILKREDTTLRLSRVHHRVGSTLKDWEQELKDNVDNTC